MNKDLILGTCVLLQIMLSVIDESISLEYWLLGA